MKKKSTRKITKLIISFVIALGILSGVFISYKETGNVDKNEIGKAVNVIVDGIKTYNMSENEVEDLPSTEIVAQSEEDEQATGAEQATTENEKFEEQGEIAYNGTSEFPQIELGNYTGLTYYSQIDWRWKTHSYTAIGNNNQTIGTSGCGPTSAAMVVTAIKGTITPEKMGDLFVQYGYRSANNGTYFSAFRWAADVFDIEYQETYKLDEAINLLRNNHYVVVSCGNGLFTTGGHFIVLVGIDGDTIQIYDPYLYVGKFETSTRRGKAVVNGNSVYVSIDNFRNYANYKKFFAYKNNGTNTTKINNAKAVTTNAYTRYVNARSGLNVRAGAGTNYKRIKTLTYNSMVLVYETNVNWSRIGDNEWVCTDYLSEKLNQINNSNALFYQNTVGQTKKLSKVSNLYSNTNLTGTKYVYKANTTITILQNISANVDKIRVNKTGRIAYIDNRNYVNSIKKYTSTNSNGYSLGLYRVNARSGLNVRAGAGTKYRVKRLYKNGTRFDTYEIKDDWARTPSGWVNLKYCKLIRKY